MATAGNANGKPKSTGKKPPATKPAAKAASGYDWGDGKAVHTITLAQHQANAGGVQNYGVTPNTPLDAPLTSGTAYGIAQATAGRTYDPQIQANAQLQTNTPAWYQSYIDRTAAAQKAQQAYAAPLVQQAQAGVENAKATAPGLDASSPQYAAEQQAAAGRAVMAQNSANYLGGVASANDAYLAGQGNVAARELPQVQAGLLSQYGQLQTAKQQAATEAYGQLRTQEQNAAIARQTLGLNTASAAADVDLKRGVDPVTGKPLPADAPTGYRAGGPGQNKYGYTYDEWSALSDAAKNKARAGGGSSAAAKDAEKKADAAKKEAAKKQAAIKTATGKIKVDVSNVVSKWNGLVGSETDDTSKPADPVTGKYPGRPVTPADMKKILGAKYDAGLIHVALLVRTGKALDKAAIDYLHSKDPNLRIPREWLDGKKTAAAPVNRPATPAPKNDKSGYGSRPT